MDRFKFLRNYKLKADQPNFLMGLAGNGISRTIQNEIVQEKHDDVYYINFTNLKDIEENAILLEIMNAILDIYIGVKLTPENIENYHTHFSVFKSGYELLKDKRHRKHILIIFDEFHKLKNYSNAFFFTLDKILSVGHLIYGLQVSSILISDEYINPFDHSTPEGIRKFCFHFLNFDIIPPMSLDDLQPTKSLADKYTSEIGDAAYQLSGGNPSLWMSIVHVATNNSHFEPEKLFDDYEIEWKLLEIWESIGKENQEIVNSILTGRNFKVANKLQALFLEKTGLVDLENRTIKIKLLEMFEQQQINDYGYLPGQNYIKIDDTIINVSELTPHQEKILLLLFINKNKLVLRDQIGKEMWGKNYLNRYSDYAIDKQISKLRALLGSYGLKDIITTRKGKGYVLKIV